MKPNFDLRVNNTSLGAQATERLINLQLIDKRGLEADELTINFDDYDGSLILPARGVSLACALGFDNNLINKGSFIVDEISAQGPPDQLTIRARSANFSTAFKSQKQRSFKKQTIGDIVTTIANNHGYTALVAESLSKIIINQIDQNHESDGNLITRIAYQYDAIASVKNNNLLFMPIGKAVTVTGKPLAVVSINRSDGDSYQFQQADRQSRYSGVAAKWHNRLEKKQITETAGNQGYRKTLKTLYPNKAEALAAATAEWQRLQRQVSTLNLMLAEGRPEIITEQQASCSGYKQQINQQAWLIKEITHDLNDSGLTSAIQLESYI